MPRSSKQRRALARAQHLPRVDQLPRDAARPELAQVHADALAPLWIATWVHAALLVAALAYGTVAVGHLGAALLAGAPAGLQVLLATLGRAPRRRRVCMVLATTTSGFLALTTVGAVLGLGRAEGRAFDPILFQVACFALAAAHLAVARPCWQRANREGDAARALAALHDEL